MAKEKISVKQRFTCDGCGYEKVFETATPTQGEIQEILSWITVVRAIQIAGEAVTLHLDAHTKECLPLVADKFDAIEIEQNRRVMQQLRDSEKQIDRIDLASLRTSSGETKN
jgi:hypothetical protein